MADYEFPCPLGGICKYGNFCEIVKTHKGSGTTGCSNGKEIADVPTSLIPDALLQANDSSYRSQARIDAIETTTVTLAKDPEVGRQIVAKLGTILGAGIRQDRQLWQAPSNPPSTEILMQ